MLKDFALKELARINMVDLGGDTYEEEVTRNILSIVDKFCEGRHSGGSAAYTVDVVSRLLRFLPLSPLTGADDEWCHVDPENDIYQNKRCFTVFKNGKDGKPYQLTNSDEVMYIEFPYTP